MHSVSKLIGSNCRVKWKKDNCCGKIERYILDLQDVTLRWKGYGHIGVI